jgi:Cu/Ag efflux protein CusF
VPRQLTVTRGRRWLYLNFPLAGVSIWLLRKTTKTQKGASMFKAVVRSAFAIALAGAVLGLTQTARAEGGKKAEKPKQHQATGEITAVDTTANTVTIKHKTANMTFTLAPDVKYGSGGENVNLNITNLKVGDKVTIHYTEDSGKMTAHKIGKVDLSERKTKQDEKKATQ